MNTEVIRESDGELLGYVRPSTSDSWEPVTVFGHPLGPATTHEDAVAVVESRGLAVLMDRWWFRRYGEWYRCAIVEASPQRVRVQADDLRYTGPLQVTIDRPTVAVLSATEPAQG